jgi:hypothetical protein
MNHMSRTRSKIERRPTASADGGTTTVRRKKKAYAGAYVAEPRRQVNSGFVLAGRLMQHIHNFVIDMDLTSLYPSIMLLLNLSPKTFAGKLMFRDSIDIPMYNIQFLDRAEKAEYKCNANDFFMETYVGKHWWALFEIFFKMKTSDEIMNYIAEHMDQFAA